MQTNSTILTIVAVSISVCAMHACGSDGDGSGDEVDTDVSSDTSVADTSDVAGEDTLADSASGGDTASVDTVIADTTVVDTNTIDTVATMDTVELQDTQVTPDTTCAEGTEECACRDSGDACDSGLVCDPADDTCVVAKCENAASCDDSEVCTSDVCNPLTGCSYANNALNCEDGDACTEGDKCSAGECISGSAVDCDDELDCTLDTCDQVAGCQYDQNHTFCDDGVGCTVDFCNATLGCLNSAIDANCDDDNPCTTDSCHVDDDCQHESHADGSSCVNNAECVEARECVDAGVATKTCGALGWNSGYGTSNVCGESDGDDLGGCSNEVSWHAAAGFCVAAGARLCTSEELKANETRGTGCGYDANWVWSSTACDGGFILQAGSTVYAGDKPEVCAAPGEHEGHYARCCAATTIVDNSDATSVCALKDTPAQTEVCTASDPGDVCAPTGECSVTGVCVDVWSADGGACDDTDAATGVDLCFDGTCVGCIGDPADPADDSVSFATPVPDDSLVEAVMCPADVDLFAVEVPDKGALIVDVGDGVGDLERPCGDDLDLEIVAPDGETVIAESDATGAGSCPAIGPAMEEEGNTQANTMDVSDLAAGTYYARVFGTDAGAGDGAYSIRAIALEPSTRVLGGSTSADEPMDANATWYWSELPKDAVDWYRVPVTADAPSLDITVGFFMAWGLEAELFESDGQTSILAVADTSLGLGDDWEGSRLAGPAVTDLTPGDYLLKVTWTKYLDDSVVDLPYALRIQRGTFATLAEVETNDTVDAATALDNNVTSVTASLGDGDSDWFSFDVWRRARVTFATGLATCTADTFLEVLDHNGTAVLQTDSDGGQGECSRLVRTMDPGTYTLHVTENGPGGTGDYTFFIIGR